MRLMRVIWRAIFGRPRRVHKLALLMEWPQLWYENNDGERWIPGPDHNDPHDFPGGFHYMRVSRACELEEHCFRIRDDKSGSKKITSGHMGVWREVVEQMVRAGHRLDKSILIVANACERCVNALAWEYGVGGYELGSQQWQEAGTACRICETGTRHVVFGDPDDDTCEMIQGTDLVIDPDCVGKGGAHA